MFIEPLLLKYFFGINSYVCINIHWYHYHLWRQIGNKVWWFLISLLVMYFTVPNSHVHLNLSLPLLLYWPLAFLLCLLLSPLIHQDMRRREVVTIVGIFWLVICHSLSSSPFLMAPRFSFCSLAAISLGRIYSSGPLPGWAWATPSQTNFIAIAPGTGSGIGV